MTREFRIQLLPATERWQTSVVHPVHCCRQQLTSPSAITLRSFAASTHSRPVFCTCVIAKIKTVVQVTRVRWRSIRTGRELPATRLPMRYSETSALTVRLTTIRSASSDFTRWKHFLQIVGKFVAT